MDMKYYLTSVYNDLIIRECGYIFVNFLLVFFIHFSIMWGSFYIMTTNLSLLWSIALSFCLKKKNCFCD